MKHWILPALCGIAALILLLYPLVSELVNQKYHSDIETAYTDAIEGADNAELEQQLEAAQQYNALLAGSILRGGAFAPPLAYEELLTTGGAICYIEIPKISVHLPVQYGEM